MNGVVIGGSDTRAAAFTECVIGAGATISLPGEVFMMQCTAHSAPGGVSFGSDDNSTAGFFDLRCGLQFWHIKNSGSTASQSLQFYHYNGSYSDELLRVDVDGMITSHGVITFINTSSFSTVAGGAKIGAIAGLMSVLNDGGTTRTIALNGEVIKFRGFTVATLPSGNQGDNAFVTDALAPTFLATIVGGGAIVTPVFYNGTAWVGA